MVRSAMRFAERNAIGLLALFVALGGSSYALTATPRSTRVDGRVHACVKTKTGIPRIVRQGSRCPRGSAALTWSKAGPSGAAGPAGSTGPAGSIQGAPAGGDLAGAYPAPTIAPAEAPVQVRPNPGTPDDPCLASPPASGVFCGAPSEPWRSGGLASVGMQFWRDRVGEVHVRGEARAPTVASPTHSVFVLPLGYRPGSNRTYTVSVGSPGALGQGSSALAFVRRDGIVEVFANTSLSDVELFFGEIVFRTDA
jgi:hypothetical protein